MEQEGVIKYKQYWTVRKADFLSFDDPLIQARDKLFQMGLIGEYKDTGVGYGNISKRFENNFIISGTQTGTIAHSKPHHYSLVTNFDIGTNTLHCRGPIKASSEALTHGAIYNLSKRIQGVVHIHSQTLWKKHLYQLPTTSPDVPYGTAAMAKEIQHLFAGKNKNKNILVMAGHEDGIISFGEDLCDAMSLIEAL